VAAVRVEIVSDVVCPWCYIGKRRFERALSDLRRTLPNLGVEVRWRAYQLDSNAPTDTATPVSEAYAKRFGGPERAEEILQQVTATAAAEGIAFDMKRALRANTLRAHRLLKFVEELTPELQGAVTESLMAAYFNEGADIGDPRVLTACAQRAGFDHPDLVRMLSGSDDRWSNLVAEDLLWAAERDITAVPTFVIDDAMVIPGAQDTSTFVRILQRMASR
jgi:predicted DsbA family dithiol-disulfide isomerase